MRSSQQRIFDTNKTRKVRLGSESHFLCYLQRGLEKHKRFGEFWQLIKQEFDLSKEMALKVSGQKTLLEDNPTSQASIKLRMSIVLPLLVIQQYALTRVNDLANSELNESETDLMQTYEKMIVRSLFGNINASRNKNQQAMQNSLLQQPI